ncbi:PH domain-containing protein [Marinactinospora thermotolerans]|nr:PH domain-containing protein [Marinactinospora thermotolerans]
MVAYGLAGLLFVTMAVLALILPADWKFQDRVGLLLLGVLSVGVLHLLARPRVTATDEGVTIVNSIRTHVLVWPEIVDVRMPVGEPWPSVDLADGSTLAVMGIQSNDGDRAQQNLAALRALLRERGEAAEPGH